MPTVNRIISIPENANSTVAAPAEPSEIARNAFFFRLFAPASRVMVLAMKHPRGIALPGAAALLLTLAACAVDREAGFAAGAPGERTTAERLIDAGDREARAANWPAAVTLYRSAHAARPEDATALVRLGHALNAAGAPGDGAEAFRQALRLAPGDADAERGLGNAFTALGQPRMALPYYRAALETVPEDWRVHLGLGSALDLTGDQSGAQAAYREGLAIAPGNPDLLANLGLSLVLAGDAAQGLDSARAAVARPDAGPEHDRILVMALALAGDSERARELAARDRDPRGAEADVRYFETLRALEDPAARLKALRAYQSGVPAS